MAAVMRPGGGIGLFPAARVPMFVRHVVHVADLGRFESLHGVAGHARPADAHESRLLPGGKPVEGLKRAATGAALTDLGRAAGGAVTVMVTAADEDDCAAALESVLNQPHVSRAAARLSSEAALMATGRLSGCVVDVGVCETRVSFVREGVEVARRALAWGGADVSRAAQAALGAQAALVDGDGLEAWKRAWERPPLAAASVPFELPDGSTVQVPAPMEPLFAPAVGLAAAVHEVAARYDPRGVAGGAVVLAGAAAAAPGLPARLQAELDALPALAAPLVVSHDTTHVGERAWRGASFFAARSTFEDTETVTAQVVADEGAARAVRRYCRVLGEVSARAGLAESESEDDDL